MSLQSSFVEDVGDAAVTIHTGAATLSAVMASGKCSQGGAMWLWIYDHAAPTSETEPLLCVPFNNDGQFAQFPGTPIATKLAVRVTAAPSQSSAVVPCGNMMTLWFTA